MRLLIFGAAIALAAIIHSPASAACDPAGAKALYMAAIAPDTVPGTSEATTIERAPAIAERPARATMLEKAAAGYQECATGAVRVPALLAAMNALQAADATLESIGPAGIDRANADSRIARKIALAIARDPSADPRSKQLAADELNVTDHLRTRGE